MDPTSYIQYVAALAFVLVLIGGLALLARRFGMMPRPTPGGSRDRRLSGVEVAPIDARRRMVLVRRDDTEHLLLLGLNGDLVIERGIRADRASAANADQD